MDRREIGCPKHLAAELNETPVFADGSLHGTNCGKNRPLHSERQLGYGGLVQCFAVEETRCPPPRPACRSEEHTSELQSLMRISYAVFCLKKKKRNDYNDKLNITI